MTGEVTLQGRVLPIGGLKQKVLAAHAAGLTEVILPERNEPDLDDVPRDVREHMQFHPVSVGRRSARARAGVGAEHARTRRLTGSSGDGAGLEGLPRSPSRPQSPVSSSPPLPDISIQSSSASSWWNASSPISSFARIAITD